MYLKEVEVVFEVVQVVEGMGQHHCPLHAIIVIISHPNCGKSALSIHMSPGALDCRRLWQFLAQIRSTQHRLVVITMLCVLANEMFVLSQERLEGDNVSRGHYHLTLPHGVFNYQCSINLRIQFVFLMRLKLLMLRLRLLAVKQHFLQRELEPPFLGFGRHCRHHLRAQQRRNPHHRAPGIKQETKQ